MHVLFFAYIPSQMAFRRYIVNDSMLALIHNVEVVNLNDL